MNVTAITWLVSILGLLIMGLLTAVQLVAVISPRGKWTVENVYGGSPEATDEKAYFAVNQGYAWADVFFWAPIQLAGSVGMLLGQKWGFLLALMGSIPFVYTGITIFIWDRDLGFRKNTFTYWVIVWAMFPAFGILEACYCFIRLMN
ncbi:MAG: hypothetical protein ACYTFG_01195 [Planctomycetota bacterium]